MKIVIFGGTTEGRELSALLAEAGASVTVCVATEYGEEEQGSVPDVETRTGPMSAAEKRELLHDAGLCVDATHPYARHVSQSVKTACGEAKVEYIRLLRPACEAEGALVFDSAPEAAAWLREREGRVLLTTGAKELSAYADLDPERLIPRVLPSHEALNACEALGIPHRNVIAMQGPFTAELNAATIRQYAVRYIVTKDGGGPGGFPEKARAAKETGTQLLVLRRPADSGLPFCEVLNLCKTRIRDANIEKQGETK